MKCFRVVLPFIAFLALLTGCSRDPNVRKQKYFESGQRYVAEHKYREAAIQFRNAIQVDGTFTAAHYELAQTYLKLQDFSHAYSELSRTLELQPDNYKAHADMANLLILSARTNTGFNAERVRAAQEHTDLLLEKQPDDADTHTAVANLLGVQGKYPEAIVEAQKAVALAPQRGDCYLNLAILQAQANQAAAAEGNFKKAIELKASGSTPNLALATFYQSQRRYKEAEEQVKTVIAANPKDTDSRAALGRLYLAQGKKAEAEEFLKTVKRDLPEDSAAYRMLGDFYYAIGDLDKATSEYQSLYSEHPKDPLVQKNYVQLLLLKDRVDEADRVNEVALKARPKDDAGLTFRGEIQNRRGKPNDAVKTLQDVISANPDSAIAHYQLGIAFSLLSDLSQAGAEWQKAIQINPEMVEAQRSLAALAITRSDLDGLQQAATQIIRLQPTSPDGYSLRAVSYTARNQVRAAEQDARKAIEVAPQSGAGYTEMGRLRLSQRQFSEAESWYRQALSHDANSVDALQGLLNSYVAQKQLDKAIAATNTQIALSPKNSVFYDLLGSLLMQKNDFAAAEAPLKKSIELNKNNSDAYMKLGQSELRRGLVDNALATYKRGSEANPKEAGFLIAVGSVYETKHDLDSAKKAYQTALQMRPRDPIASNNLAYVLLETNANPDMALQLAQDARRSLPGNSNVADTLGWAFYQKGIYSSAVTMFEEAIKLAAKNKEPENATYHYHLGLAYAKSEKPVLARQHFERVLKLDPKYSGADDIRKQLAQLKS